jgi:hypothetical protein
MAIIFCHNCGMQSSGGNFCASCGSNLNQTLSINSNKNTESSVELISCAPATLNSGKDKPYFALGSFNFIHSVGLPIAENVLCRTFYCYDKIVFESSGVVFTLPMEIISDVTLKSDVEIQKNFVSSVGGAVGGAVLFGPLGAIIGGRAKQKKSKKTTYYLVITYIKDNQVQYIGFDVTHTIFAANKLLKLHKKRTQQQKISVEL